MSQPLIDFESSRVKEQKKLEAKKARQEILERVRNEFEAKEKQRVDKVLRGENSWVLPSVEASLRRQGEHSHKKHKKEKKSKKKKAKKRRRSSTSSSDSENSEVEWVEKGKETKPCTEDTPLATPTPPKDPNEGREEWMQMSSLCGVFSRDEMRAREGNSRVLEKIKEKNKQPDKPGSHSLELNPYFKDGGTGLPPTESSIPQQVGPSSEWLKKSLKRAKEQAQEEQKTLEEIAEKRWGSLDKFHEMLNAAEERERQNESINRRKRDRYPPRQQDHRSQRRKSPERHWRDRKKSPDTHRGLSGSPNSKEDSKKRSKKRRSSYSSSSSSDEEPQRLSSHNRNRRSRSRERTRRGRSNSPQNSNRRFRKPGSPNFSRDSSPDSRPRRMLRPGDQPKEAPSKSDVAVWDSRASLSSSRSAPIGGWKKKKASDEGAERERKDQGTSREKERAEAPQHRQEEEERCSPASERCASPAPPPKPVKILTEHELNQLGAKIVKAELVGNEALAAKLKKKLETARAESEKSIKEKLASGETEKKEDQEVLLTATNERGFTRPVSYSEDDKAANQKGRKKPKVVSTGADGQRDKYFPDDNKFSLKDMFEKEKMGTSDDSDALFVRAAARAHKATLDDDYTLDDSFVDKSVGREDAAGQNSRDRMKAIMEHQKREKALSSCPHCLDSPRLQKHLIVSLGTKSYLSLPPHQSMVPGHCLIVPREHLGTSTLIDEDTWQEMKVFRQSLVQYFGSLEEDVLFLECCMRLHQHPHTVVHCIPLPRELGDVAPIYYKKAIQESESEWSQNIKLVDLSGRDVRRAIPKGFAYFAVDFGSQGGYAHVIEDEATFPSYFGLSVAGGMLDLEPNLWRKPRQEKFEDHRRKVIAFSKGFGKFDPQA